MMQPFRFACPTRLLLALLLLLCPVLASATVYAVGPGQAYTTLSAVPWAKLAPGDTVNIYWQPQPYREMILISTRGTAANPITVQGIADPSTGQLPIIDGQNAVQSASLPYHDKNNAYSSQILYQLGPVMVGPPLGNASNNLPQYITIQNLVVRNANQNYTFTDYTGRTTHYNSFAAAIYVEGAQHLTIRNCTLTGSGNGLFINSKYGSTGVSTDVLVEGNSIYGNGNVGDVHTHNVYTETAGIVFQYNYIGDIISGAGGNALKDRSAGTVIRYNWIGAGGHCIDLVETQAGQGYIDLLPSYKQTFVYGNLIWSGPQGASLLVHYGGDQSDYTYYRRGTLYFYDNTVVSQADQLTDRYNTIAFTLPTLGETGNQRVEEVVDCRNSIFYSFPRTPGQWESQLQMLSTDGTGTLNLSRNWLSPDTGMYHPIFNGTFIGTITGWNNNLFGNALGANDPGFMNFAQGDLRPASGSNCVNAAGPLASAAATSNPVLMQYAAPASAVSRSSVSDIGALAAASGTSSPDFTLAAAPASQSVAQGAGTNYTVSVTASNGFAATTSLSVTGLPTGATATFTPASVAGAGSSTLAVTTASTTPSGSYTLTIQGTSGALVHSTTATLSVTAVAAPALSSLSLNPTSVSGGASSTGTVTLTAAAPSGGALVSLSSNNAAAQVPASVTVAAGANSATFSVTTSAVTADTVVTLTAVYQSVNKSANLTVKAPVTSGGIAVDKQVSTHQSSASTKIVSPAFSTTGSNELLLAFLTSDGPASRSQSFASVTGGGLTWRLRQRTNTRAGTAEIWQAVATAPLSNVTITATRSSGSYVGSMTVVAFTGASTTTDGTVASANSSIGAPTATLTTTRAGSWVWGVGDDWDNAIARTVGANQTKVDEFLASTGDTFWVQRQNSPTAVSGTAVTLNDTAPTTDRWNLCLIEILPQ